MYKKVYIYYYLLVFTLGEEVGGGEGGAGVQRRVYYIYTSKECGG